MLTKLKNDIDGGLMTALELGDEPLPLLWTCDYIPKNPEGSFRRRNSFDFARKPPRRPPRKPFAGWAEAENAGDDKTEYVVGEFNCSCVGISKFQAVCGGEKTLADVSDEDYFDACELTNLMGVKALEMIKKKKGD